jgi:hypothetical protein
MFTFILLKIVCLQFKSIKMNHSQRVELKKRARIIRAIFIKVLFSGIFRKIIKGNPSKDYLEQITKDRFKDWSDERIVGDFLEIAKPLNINTNQIFSGLERLIQNDLNGHELELYQQLVLGVTYKFYKAGKELHKEDMIDRFKLKG